jgi:hypothetical protein
LDCSDKITIGGKGMHKFGKVVLSRKGFDSSAGGDFSPFDPETGKYIVLPIPMGEKELAISNHLKYEEIKIKKNHLDGCPETDLKSLRMKSLRIEKTTITVKDKKEESEYTHFDPWLGPCPWLAGDSNHQIGAFGQVGGAQTHLKTKDVGEGSLFLFFSRFKPIKPISQNTEKGIVPGISSKHLNEGLYFIYGWLKVKKVIQQYKDIKDIIDDKSLQSLKSLHPHATEKYFEKYANKKGKNTLYIADKLLFNDGSNFPGCGYFPRLNKDLCLTASDLAQAQKPGNWIPSRWKLPGFFYDTRPSFLCKEEWSKSEDDTCLVKIPKRWQEAVFDETEKFCQWFDRLLESC